MYVGKLAFARWWYWRDGAMAARRRTIPIYETLDSYNFYFPHATAAAAVAVACLCFRVFRKKPTPLQTYSTRTRMHLKETRKFSISACKWPVESRRPPTWPTAVCVCVCVWAAAWYGNISGHIMHFIAIEKNMFMCRSERKDLDIVCAMLLLLLFLLRADLGVNTHTPRIGSHWDWRGQNEHVISAVGR